MDAGLDKTLTAIREELGDIRKELGDMRKELGSLKNTVESQGREIRQLKQAGYDAVLCERKALMRDMRPCREALPHSFVR
jgi:archaellum component FlaC